MGRGRDEAGERGERKTFLLPPLLATEAIFIARRREERGEGRAREREKEMEERKSVRTGEEKKLCGLEREGERERDSLSSLYFFSIPLFAIFINSFFKDSNF